MAKGIYATFSIVMIAAAANIADLSVYFPQVGSDAGKVTWGHAINSKADLDDAINDTNIMMLEADVLSGQLLRGSPNSNEQLPIMSHPPELTSDLSLDEWIKQVIDANEQRNYKGAKLDFKEIGVVEESLMILKNYSAAITFPLWLNADILAGPGAVNKTPVDRRSFLNLCKKYFPKATLSIGWTTGYDSEMDYKYTADMVQLMATTILVHNIKEPITFPIRASLIKSSLKNLIKLMDMVPNSSFTIWSVSDEPVDMTGVADLIGIAGRHRVYLDLPNDQRMSLDSINQANLHSTADHINSIIFILIGLITFVHFYKRMLMI